MGKSGVLLKTRLILEQDEKILLLKQTKINGGAYTLVGGKVEQAELAKQSLLRESWEEVGLILKETDLQLVHILHKLKHKQCRVTLFFSAARWTGNIAPRERHKFKELEWHPANQLPANTKGSIRTVVKRYQEGFLYTELMDY